MPAITSSTSSQPISDTGISFDETAWRVVCEKVAVQASNGCGLSHDYYVERFSSEIERHVDRLPESQRTQALQIAQDWDYATPAERQETDDWNAENGYCTHGIELGCCPAGCGS
ncbi:hypothetical protein DN603_09745 [Raoultella planticola]|uniref:Uncharacterized protein n=1 Tax=Raoultella planticola TaxID=575 RepID=A0A443VP96_RAOPL|nr:hypothetical protein [Raoultella planticola]RWT23367.1 hypothetical protein DN603_09745 [Raoultella planticola]